uniref:Wall-associated receptor kinase galacturonan-binding domain-containing protein n=1 Tax=Hordeum vulgare subsp. vulgare TaxID=112509 RepID=A0A8I6WN78_HORVV
MAIASCWFLVMFVWVLWWLPLMLAVAGPEEEQQREGCSSSGTRCGNLTFLDPFWLTNWQTGKSCGPLDFEVACFFNKTTPVLKTSGLVGFAILNISYENHSLRVVDLYKEKDLNVSSKSCNFPRWNTSGELAPPFKVDPANNQNLILYDCTKTTPQRDTALVEMRCGNASNAFVRAGGRSNETGDYALDGCNATVVPVMSLSSSGKANASDYERLISGGFLLTWDLPPPLRARVQKGDVDD